MFKICATLVLSVLSFSQCTEPRVNLQVGVIRGFKQNINEKEVNVFLGVPYAEPPLDSKRFRKPYPLTKKPERVVEAKKWPNMCMQTGEIIKGSFSEDCLYLNIWTPVALSANHPQNQKPVMVFIPGGAFVFDGISERKYNASVLSSYGDVVVVTLNYRLGALGFLFGNTEEVPGNMGLYDQQLALQWINENIVYFGGNKNQITLFGESAGGMSVSLHMISPSSQPLFKNAIVMSGVSVESMIPGNSKVEFQKALKFVELVGCPVSKNQTSLSSSAIECLSKVDANTLIAAQFSLEIVKKLKNPGIFTFSPIYGDELIPKLPKQSWTDLDFKRGMNLLIGTVANDGIVLESIVSRYNAPSDTYKKIIQKYFSNTMTPSIANDLLKIYFTNVTESDGEESQHAFYHLLSDVFFDCPSFEFAEKFSQVNTVYQYLFDYIDAKGPFCKGFGPCHSYELPFTFGTTQNEKDNKVSLEWIKIFSEFAKTGTVSWPKYQKTESNVLIPFYFRFTGYTPQNGHNIGYRFYYCNYWKNVVYKNLNNL